MHDKNTRAWICSHCGGRLPGLRARISKIQPYALNDTRLCGEACFRKALQFLLENWFHSEFDRVVSPWRKRIGMILLDSKVINPPQLEKVLDAQRGGDSHRVGEILQQFGYASERQVTVALSQQEGLPWLDTELKQDQVEAKSLVPPEVAVTSLIQPFDYNSIINELYILAAAPVDRMALSALEQMQHCQVKVFVGPESKVRKAIAQFYVQSPIKHSAFPPVHEEGEYLNWVIESTCSFYRSTGAMNLNVVRCRELLWMRAASDGSHFDRFVLLEPYAQNLEQVPAAVAQ